MQIDCGRTPVSWLFMSFGRWLSGCAGGKFSCELSTKRIIFHQSIANPRRFGHTIVSQGVKLGRFLTAVLLADIRCFAEAGYESKVEFEKGIRAIGGIYYFFYVVFLVAAGDGPMGRTLGYQQVIHND